MLRSIRLVVPVLFAVQMFNWSLAAEKSTQPAKPQEPTADLFQLIDPAVLKESPTDDELRKLMKERYTNAASAVEFQYRMFSGGRGDIDSVFEAGRESIAAALDLCLTPLEKFAVLEKVVKVMKYYEEATSKRAEGGLANQGHVHAAKAKRLEAEIQLLKVKQELAKAK